MRFSHVFWIDASSRESIELGLMHIGQANNEVKQSARSVLQWIFQTDNWLMVYDGADGDYQIVEKFFPPGNGGNILMTSRNGGLKRIALTSLKVLNMAEEEAATMLLKSASLDGMSADVRNLAQKVASQLGRIPLALDQAGAYMLTSQCDIVDYLELYTKNKHELMPNPGFKGASDYDRTTYGTWDILMQMIERMAAKDIEEEAPAAQSVIRILRILAFLDHTNIPQELFKNAAENYMTRDIEEESNYNIPLSIELLDYETLFLTEDGVWDKMKFLAGIQVLISFSFIEAHSQLYSMHLLVHSWNRNRIPKEDMTTLYHKARAFLSCSITIDYIIDNYAFCRLLAPHVRANGLHASELELKSTYYDDEYERFTHVFHDVGSWNEAVQRITILGANHLKYPACISKLASTYRRQGKLDKAEKLDMDVMNTSRAKLVSDHSHTLGSMANLATTYSK